MDQHAIIGKFMLFLGKSYELLYRLPLVGESLVRAINRFIGRINFYSPGTGLKRRDSIDEIKADLQRLQKMTGFKFDFSETQGDQFEFFVLECPYGFHRPDQLGPCDAAMNMDRTLFRLCGAELTVEESIPGGASKCRETMKLIKISKDS